MRAPSTLQVVEDGDHSLMVSKTALKARGSTQEGADGQIETAIAAFLGGLTGA